MAASYWICLLFAFSAAAQVVPAPDAPATLDGRVVNSATGEVVRKARVILESKTRENDPVVVATTDDAGHFRFANIASGVYRLIAEKYGFIGGSYGQTKPEADEVLLKVNPGDRLQDVTLRLFPGATISGRILDADGDPVAGQQVLARRKLNRRSEPTIYPAGESTTNEAGEYRINGLSRGTYYVSADPESAEPGAHEILADSAGQATKLRDMLTFYPAALSIGDTQPIHVEAGQEQSGIDIRMQRAPALSVKGKIAGIGSSLSRYELSASVPEAFGWTSDHGKILPGGDFIFDELPPGNHTLTLREHGPNGPQIIGQTEITLADQDLTGVLITPFKPAEVRVRVVHEGEENELLTNGSVFLIPEEHRDTWMGGAGQTDPQNGVYIVHNVRPGKYEVRFNQLSDCYLKSVESAGRMLGPESIDIAEGANLDLLLTYSPNVASVVGDVEVPADRAPSPFHVVLVSETNSGTKNDVRTVELDQASHFTVQNLRPAKYLFFAAEEDDSELWSNSDFVKLLEDNAAEVELHEKQQATVHLKIVSKDVTDRARQQLGL